MRVLLSFKKFSKNPCILKSEIYPKNLKNRLWGSAKVSIIVDRKLVRIALVKTYLQSLWSTILGSFRDNQKTDFPGIYSYIFCFCLILLIFLIPFDVGFNLPKSFSWLSKLFDHGTSHYLWRASKYRIHIIDLLGVLFLIDGIRLIFKKKQEPFVRVCICILALFILSPIISFAFSGEHFKGCKHFIVNWVPPVGTFIWLLSAFNPKKLFKLVSWSFLMSGFIQAILGIVQYFMQRNLIFEFLGEDRLKAYFMCASRWLFDPWINFHSPSLLIYRAQGTMEHPNILGGLLSVSIAITLYQFSQYLPKERRHFFGFAFFIQFFALMITYSRSALLATTLSIFCWMIWNFFQKNRIRSYGTLVLVSTIITGILLYPQILARGGIVNSNYLSNSSNDLRIQLQNSAFQIIKEHPFIGVGSNYKSYLQSQDTTVDAVHNIFFLMTAQLGIIATFLLVLLFILILWRTRLSISQCPQKIVLLGVFLGLLAVGNLDHYLISCHQTSFLLFAIAGLLARYVCVSDQSNLCRSIKDESCCNANQ